MNGTKQQNMANFLNNAKKVMAKSDALSPLPKKNIPTLDQLPADLVLENYNQYGNSYEQQYQPQQYQQNFDGTPTKAAGNLPSAILSSLMSNPIADYGQMNGLSVLDGLIPTPQPQPQQRRQMNEEYYPGEKQMPTTEELLMKSRAMHEQLNPQAAQPRYQQQTQTPTSGSGVIDYSLIKLMIEDCIAKEFKTLKQTILTETKNNGGDKGEIIMTVGNTIRFVRKDGRIFEGRVKDTGRNINE